MISLPFDYLPGKEACIMPAASPFKSAISRDADCLIFDCDVQNLTATLPTPDVLPAHDRVGTALAF
jgi:hypothetical protein